MWSKEQPPPASTGPSSDDGVAEPHMPPESLCRFVITPHQSLAGKAFRAMLYVMFAPLAAVLIFLLATGVWIAAAAVLLCAAILGIAFWANHQYLRRFETLSLHSGSIAVTTHAPGGAALRRSEVPALGLTVHRTFDPDYGCLRVALVSRGKAVEVAAALSPQERKPFAEAFIAALRQHGLAPRIVDHEMLSHPV